MIQLTISAFACDFADILLRLQLRRIILNTTDLVLKEKAAPKSCFLIQMVLKERYFAISTLVLVTMLP